MKACAAWLALWNDVDSALDEEYNAWHGSEHVPQRLTVPGIHAAIRYRAEYDNQLRYFTWYGLSGLDVLVSPEYQRLLAQPTPWSSRMRTALRQVRRLACRTRLASVALPGDWIRTLVLARGRGDEVAPIASPLPFIVGEVDTNSPVLPWVQHGQAMPHDDARWVRLENVDDPLPGAYRLIQDFSR